MSRPILGLPAAMQPAGTIARPPYRQTMTPGLSTLLDDVVQSFDRLEVDHALEELEGAGCIAESLSTIAQAHAELSDAVQNLEDALCDRLDLVISDEDDRESVRELVAEVIRAGQLDAILSRISTEVEYFDSSTAERLNDATGVVAEALAER